MALLACFPFDWITVGVGGFDSPQYRQESPSVLIIALILPRLAGTNIVRQGSVGLVTQQNWIDRIFERQHFELVTHEIFRPVTVSWVLKSQFHHQRQGEACREIVEVCPCPAPGVLLIELRECRSELFRLWWRVVASSDLSRTRAATFTGTPTSDASKKCIFIPTKSEIYYLITVRVKVGAGNICVFELAVAEVRIENVGVCEVCVFEDAFVHFCVSEEGSFEVCVGCLNSRKCRVRERRELCFDRLQVCSSKVGACKIRARKLGDLGHGNCGIRTCEVGIREIRTGEIRALQICPLDGGAAEIGLGKIGAVGGYTGEICARQVGAFEERSIEFRAGKVCSGQINLFKKHPAAMGVSRQVDPGQWRPLFPAPVNDADAHAPAVQIFQRFTLAAVARSRSCQQLPGAGNPLVLSFIQFVEEKAHGEDQAYEASRFHEDDDRVISQPLSPTLPCRLAKRARWCFAGDQCSARQRRREARVAVSLHFGSCGIPFAHRENRLVAAMQAIRAETRSPHKLRAA